MNVLELMIKLKDWSKTIFVVLYPGKLCSSKNISIFVSFRFSFLKLEHERNDIRNTLKGNKKIKSFSFELLLFNRRKHSLKKRSSTFNVFSSWDSFFSTILCNSPKISLKFCESGKISNFLCSALFAWKIIFKSPSLPLEPQIEMMPWLYESLHLSFIQKRIKNLPIR